MSIPKRMYNLTRKQLEDVATVVLDALLSLDSSPVAELSIDTELIILEIIQEREGKQPSPTLDAAWERIKAAYLKR